MGPRSPTFRRGLVQPRKRLSGHSGSKTKTTKKRVAGGFHDLGDGTGQNSDDCVDVDEAASHDDEANLIRVLFTDLGASNVPTRNIAGVESPPVIDRLSE